MIKFILLFIITAIATSTQSQTPNVGIGTLTPNARLEINASNPATPSNQDGILIPRTNFFPVTNPGAAQHGMLLYLTTTVSTNLPGFYYWDNNSIVWKTIGNGQFWGSSGNTGSVPANNFIGTTDNIDLRFKRNNVYSGFLAPTNTAWGNSSLQPGALGTYNTAIGSRALFTNSGGSWNVALGSGSLQYNETGGYNSAVGFNALSENYIGAGNTALGSDASGSNLDGNGNTAVGQQALLGNLSGNNNVALGKEALKLERGNNNIGLGFQAGFQNQYGNNNVFIGYQAGYNEWYSNKLYINNSSADPLNALIYGEFDTKLLRTNGRMEINGGGADALTLLNGGDVRIYNTDGSGSTLFYAQGGTGANNATFIIASDGKSFSFNGAGGTVSSDARLKQDITPIDRSLEKLLQLNGYSYRFKTKANIEKKEIGILAQEVLKVLPEAVFTNDDGTYSVSYNSLVPLLINGMKDQQKIIEDQDERIKKLEQQMSLLLKHK